MNRVHLPHAVLVILAVGLCPLANHTAHGQSSSLFGNSQQGRSLTIRDYSWTYLPPPEPKTIGLHDVISVLVDEQAVVISEGEIDRKKKAHGELSLTDWIILKNWSLTPDPQTNGDPTIKGKVDNKIRAEAGLETRESIKFKIACTVIDKRPNGNLIIEGHDTVKYNNEEWNLSFTGEIRPEDVMPNNTVLSESIANKRIFKQESGHVRDGYRRGWMQQFLDKIQPF